MGLTEFIRKFSDALSYLLEDVPSTNNENAVPSRIRKYCASEYPARAGPKPDKMIVIYAKTGKSEKADTNLAKHLVSQYLEGNKPVEINIRESPQKALNSSMPNLIRKIKEIYEGKITFSKSKTDYLELSPDCRHLRSVLSPLTSEIGMNIDYSGFIKATNSICESNEMSNNEEAISKFYNVESQFRKLSKAISDDKSVKVMTFTPIVQELINAIEYQSDLSIISGSTPNILGILHGLGEIPLSIPGNGAAIFLKIYNEPDGEIIGIEYDGKEVGPFKHKKVKLDAFKKFLTQLVENNSLNRTCTQFRNTLESPNFNKEKQILAKYQKEIDEKDKLIKQFTSLNNNTWFSYFRNKMANLIQRLNGNSSQNSKLQYNDRNSLIVDYETEWEHQNQIQACSDQEDGCGCPDNCNCGCKQNSIANDIDDMGLQDNFGTGECDTTCTPKVIRPKPRRKPCSNTCKPKPKCGKKKKKAPACKAECIMVQERQKDCEEERKPRNCDCETEDSAFSGENMLRRPLCSKSRVEKKSQSCDEPCQCNKDMGKTAPVVLEYVKEED